MALEKRRSHGPVVAAVAVSPPARRLTVSSPCSTRTAAGAGDSSNATDGGAVRTRLATRTPTTSSAAAQRSTVTVAAFRCDPRCSTRLVRAAIDTVSVVVATSKASVAWCAVTPGRSSQ